MIYDEISFHRSPFPLQHVSSGRIHPPLRVLPNSSSYPRSPIIHSPRFQVISSSPLGNVRKATKLQLESPRQDVKSTIKPTPTNGIFVTTSETNEVDGRTRDSAISPSQASPSQDIVMTLVPVTAVFVLILGLGFSIWSIRTRKCGSRKTKENTVFKKKIGYCFLIIVSQVTKLDFISSIRHIDGKVLINCVAFS